MLLQPLSISTFRCSWASIEADERAWIQQGADVDRRFAEKYYESLPELVSAAETELQKEPLHERTFQSHRWDQGVTLFRWVLIFGMSLVSLGIMLFGRTPAAGTPRD